MTEILLNAIIHLYAILSLSLPKAQRPAASAALENYLRDYLRLRNLEDYTALYAEFGELYDDCDQKRAFDSARLITGRMSEQLPLRERYIVVLHFLQMLCACPQNDGQAPEELLNIITEKFSLEQETLRQMRLFCAGSDSGATSGDTLLFIPPEVPDNALTFLHLPQAQAIFVRQNNPHQIFQLNRVPLTPRAAAEFSPGSVINSADSLKITYRQIASHYFACGLPAVTFSAQNLEFRFKNSDNGLHNFSFSALGGELIGIMGGSGAGKSTLLGLLNSTITPDSGLIEINGLNPQTFHAAASLIGCVPQDDLLFEELSVFDNLYYRARLSLADLPEAELRAKVYATLRQLGQEETAHLKVGSPLEKTISGGQRKRLNIALELIREPAILFVDEPTSGLSSSDSENVIALLRNLADGGRLVFVVIHQPSSAIFRSFDRLWLLDLGGYPVYDGPPLEALSHFSAESWQAGAGDDICSSCGNVNPEQIFQIITRQKVDPLGRFTGERTITAQKWHEKYLAASRNAAAHEPPETAAPARTEKIRAQDCASALQTPGLFAQFKIFFSRNLKAHLSNRQYLLLNLLEPPLLGAFVSLLCRGYSREEYTFYENAHLGVFFFISVIVALFMGLSISAQEIIRDRKILRQEQFLRLSWFSYLNSKTAYLLALCALQMLLYAAVAIPLLQLPDLSLELWLTLFSCAAVSAMLGLNISASLRSAITAYILIPLILIPQMLLSGAVVSFSHLTAPRSDYRTPPLFAEIMPSRWGYETLIIAQYTGNAYMKDLFPHEAVIRQADYQNDYRLPEIRALADYKFTALSTPDYPQKVARNLRLIRNELADLEQACGLDFSDKTAINLTPDGFDKAALTLLRERLTVISKELSARRAQANQIKKEILNQRKAQIGTDGLTRQKDQHHNRAIETLALQSNTLTPIASGENRLLQLIYPATQPPASSNGRAHFLAAHKKIAGILIPTPLFNLLILWLMAGGLYLCLLLRVVARQAMFPKITRLIALFTNS